MQEKATIDFETRSTVSLLSLGGWVYSEHETTEAMCMAYKLPGKEIQLWHRAHPEYFISESPLPLDLFEFIAKGGLVEAHNAFFERVIWKNIMVKRYGWPEMPHLQWRCSASKCSAAALPRALGDAAIAMDSPIEKDGEGRKLMLKMCKPRKPRKEEKELMKAEMAPLKKELKGMLPRIEEGGNDIADIAEYEAVAKEIDRIKNRVFWHEEEKDIVRQWAYCKTDVEAEEALSDRVRPLSDTELEIWQMDQFMNERGLNIDVPFVKKCLALTKETKAQLNDELYSMTGIASGTQRPTIKKWLVEHEDLTLEDTTAPTLEWYIEHSDISGRAIRILEIVKQVNKTSTRKFTKILSQVALDGRVHDILMYHGANTGRWSGKGIQVQGLPRGTVPKLDMDQAYLDIMENDAAWLQVLYGDVMELLSSVVRGTIIPSKGRDFIVADYSAIEARCVLWEADAQEALDVFRSGGDIYCDMASGIYGFPVTKANFKERQFGKQAILGLGYGMGYVTFFITCRKYKIYFSKEDALKIMGPDKLAKYSKWIINSLCLSKKPEFKDKAERKKYFNKRRAAARNLRMIKEIREDPKKVIHELALMKYTVDVFRDRYSEVKTMWKDQENAVIEAIRAVEKDETGKVIKDGVRVKCGKVTWVVENDFLYMILPSGRRVSYKSPSLKTITNQWGGIQESIRYMSASGTSGKWKRTATYGGKIVENYTQAVARDMMASAMLVIHKDPVYDIVASIHDEVVCEVDKNKGSHEGFEGLMSTIEPWAQGCPITAEADRYPRYRK